MCMCHMGHALVDALAVMEDSSRVACESAKIVTQQAAPKTKTKIVSAVWTRDFALDHVCALASAACAAPAARLMHVAIAN